MKTKIFTLILASILLLSSCATIFDGSKTRLHIKNGVPSNAKIYLDGSYCGTAPQTIKVQKRAVKRNTGGKIEIKADGYESETVTLTTKVRPGFVVFDILTGIFPIIIDAATGDWRAVRPSGSAKGVGNKTIQYNLQHTNNYIPASEKVEFKIGDNVIFTMHHLSNIDGVIKALYPSKALIVYNENGNKKQIEVPFDNIAKIANNPENIATSKQSEQKTVIQQQPIDKNTTGIDNSNSNPSSNSKTTIETSTQNSAAKYTAADFKYGEIVEFKKGKSTIEGRIILLNTSSATVETTGMMGIKSKHEVNYSDMTKTAGFK